MAIVLVIMEHLLLGPLAPQGTELHTELVPGEENQNSGPEVQFPIKTYRFTPS